MMQLTDEAHAHLKLLVHFDFVIKWLLLQFVYLMVQEYLVQYLYLQQLQLLL